MVRSGTAVDAKDIVRDRVEASLGGRGLVNPSATLLGIVSYRGCAAGS